MRAWHHLLYINPPLTNKKKSRKTSNPHLTPHPLTPPLYNHHPNQEKCNVPPPQLSRAFQDRILRPLKLTGHVHMGGPGLSPSISSSSSSSSEEAPNSQGQEQGRSIALLHHGFARQLKPLLAEMRLAAAAGGAKAPTPTPSGDGGVLKKEEEGKGAEGNGGGSSGASLPSVGGNTNGGMGALAERALLQPGMVNDPAVRVRVVCYYKPPDRPSSFLSQTQN